MKKYIMIVLSAPLLAGCSGLQHGLINAAGGAGGGFLANKLSNGDPLITAAGAGGGVLLAEGAQALASSSQQKSFKQGVETGRAQAAKEYYWELQNRQRPPKAQ
jgi:hypothetical protein